MIKLIEIIKNLNHPKSVVSLTLFTTLLLSSCASIISATGEKINKNSFHDCSPIKTEGLIGPEDFAIDYTTNTKEQTVVYISVSDRRNKDMPGGIFVYTPGTHSVPKRMSISSKKENVDTYFKKEFFPHGISLFQNQLFVINHRRDANESNVSLVEIFQISNDKNHLTHIDTIKDNITNKFYDKNNLKDIGRVDLNDLVATGPRQFYATDNRIDKWKIFKNIIAAVGFSRGNRVVYFNGEKYNPTPIQSLSFANGINVSQPLKSSKDNGKTQHKFLYVSSSANGSLYAYQFKDSRSDKPESLERIDRIGLNSGLDNIEWQEADRKNLLIASHPSLLSFLRHGKKKDPIKYAPSEVFRIPLNTENGTFEKTKIEQIFYDDGKRLSASSVAVMNPPNLLLGAVYENKILSCTK
jgi:arylesterase / paraoxonase